MSFLRHVLSTFLFIPFASHGQDTIILTVHGSSQPKLEITGYQINLHIDEMNTVCDPYMGNLTPEDQIRIFTDSLRSFGIDLSKLTHEGHGLKYPNFNDDHMGIPHPNVVQRFVLEDLHIDQIRDVQAMAKMLHIEMGEVIPIRAFAKDASTETMIRHALENAKAQVDIIADALNMSVIEIVEVYESSQFGDPLLSNDPFYFCYGSVCVKAALVSH